MISKFLLKEGELPVIYSLVFTFICAAFISDILALIGVLVTLFLLYVFKVPFRSYISVSDMLCPVDGKVMAIDKQEGQSTVYIQTSLCDAHILRAPCSGKMQVLEHRKGLNLHIDSFKAKQFNEQLRVQFENCTLEFLVGQYNMCLSLENKNDFSQHEKMGVFTHGLTKITLDKDVMPKVNIGQKVYAGITVLA
jgi:phosphatidylserine decarboxylase